MEKEREKVKEIITEGRGLETGRERERERERNRI